MSNWIHDGVGRLASAAADDVRFDWPLDFNDVVYVCLPLISFLTKSDQ